MSKSFHDDYIKANAEFRSDAGFKCYINRISDGNCCPWCDAVAGRYEYGTEPQDVFRRHDNCGCTVTYESGRTRQDVWSKKSWSSYNLNKDKYAPTVLDNAQAKATEARNLSYKGIDKSGGSGIIKKKIIVARSVGAASKNYPILLPDGNHGKVLEGTEITDIVTFAGKGTDRPIRVAKTLEKVYGYSAEEWEKVRGTAYIRAENKNRKAELHWYEAKGEIVEMKVKKYYDES